MTPDPSPRTLPPLAISAASPPLDPPHVLHQRHRFKVQTLRFIVMVHNQWFGVYVLWPETNSGFGPEDWYASGAGEGDNHDWNLV